MLNDVVIIAFLFQFLRDSIVLTVNNVLLKFGKRKYTEAFQVMRDFMPDIYCLMESICFPT